MNSEEVKNTERHLADVLRKRMAASGDETIKIRKDEAFVENPMERKDFEDTIKVVLVKAKIVVKLSAKPETLN